MPDHPPPAADRYVIGEEIAHGGMGTVFAARDTVLNRDVAVKVLHARFPAGTAAARRFVDEAKITGQLQHPAIPPVHDLGTLADCRPFLAMKLIKGDTLDALLKVRPDPAHDRGRFLAIFEQICQAVGFPPSRSRTAPRPASGSNSSSRRNPTTTRPCSRASSPRHRARRIAEVRRSSMLALEGGSRPRPCCPSFACPLPSCTDCPRVREAVCSSSNRGEAASPPDRLHFRRHRGFGVRTKKR